MMTSDFQLLLFGRFILGIGGESLNVAQTVFSATWFRDGYLNTLIGFQTSMSKLGSYAAYYFGPLFYHSVIRYFGYDQNFTLGFVMASSGLILIITILATSTVISMNIRRDLHLGPDPNNWSNELDLGLTDVLRFPVTFWCVLGLVVSFYSATFPLLIDGQAFFVHDSDTSSISGMAFLLAFFATPVVGMVLDRHGKNVTILIVGCVLGILGDTVFLFHAVPSDVSAFMLGVSYSIVAAVVWPIPARILTREVHGTAYGMLQAGINTALIYTYISLNSGVYQAVEGERAFNVCYVMALGFALALGYFDRMQGDGFLNMDGLNQKLYMSRITYQNSLGPAPPARPNFDI